MSFSNQNITATFPILELPIELLLLVLDQLSLTDLRSMSKVNSFFKSICADEIVKKQENLIQKKFKNNKKIDVIHGIMHKLNAKELITNIQLSDNTLIATNENEVLAFDLKNEKEVWQNSLNALGYLWLKNGVAICIAQENPSHKKINFFDITTGKSKLSIAIESAENKFITCKQVNNDVIALLHNGSIHCWNIFNGKENKYQLNLEVGSHPVLHATTDKIAVILPSYVTVIDRKTKKTNQIKIKGKITTSCVSGNQLIVIASIDNKFNEISFIDLALEKISKHHSISLKENCFSAVANKEHVFFENYNGKIYALNVSTFDVKLLTDVNFNGIYKLSLQDKYLFVEYSTANLDSDAFADIIICDIKKMQHLGNVGMNHEHIIWSRGRLVTTTEKSVISYNFTN